MQPGSSETGGAGSSSLPRWNLDPVYPGVESEAFRGDLSRLGALVADARAAVTDTAAREREPSAWLAGVLLRLNEVADLFETLESYAYAAYSVDTADEAASRALVAAGEYNAPVAALTVEFRNALASLEGDIAALLPPGSEGDRWVLEEERSLARLQMSAEAEGLAADLGRSGADAWTRLQETISSALSALWDADSGERKTIVELRSLAHDPDRAVRRRAWELELQTWREAEVPIAFALNGVKGHSHVVNSRRGWESTLARSIRQSRLSRPAFDALLSTMESSRPLFRRYLKAKARAIGVDALGFFDLFAPVGRSSRTWGYDESIEFIASQFDRFDAEIATFVRDAAANSWIDAEPRPGKVGGAYCTGMPMVGETRILANFDGTFDAMSTLAHELGHGWHAWVMRDLPATQRGYPMTLAETASIFSETLVFHRALDGADRAERLFLIEQFLQGSTQVIVDILSRFYFERTVMERRATGELSARELCDAMLDAQRATYGDGLDPELLHGYMWAVKPHYYHAEFGFYNFPYAFGQLFGLGLYARYETDPATFPALYRAILMETGRAPAVEVAARAEIDLEDVDFWRGALGRIELLIGEFEAAVDGS